MYGGSAELLNADYGDRLGALTGMMSESHVFAVAREATETARRLATSNASTRLTMESFLLRAGIQEK